MKLEYSFWEYIKLSSNYLLVSLLTLDGLLFNLGKPLIALFGKYGRKKWLGMAVCENLIYILYVYLTILLKIWS